MGFFYSGGGERTVLREAIGLRERGFEADVYAPTISGDCYPELMRQVGARELFWWIPEGIGVRSSLGMVLSCLLSPSLVKRFELYDAVIAHGQPSSWLAFKAKERYGTPYICYLHQTNRFLYPRMVDRQVGWGNDRDMQLIELVHKGNRLIKNLDSESVLGSDLILTNSEWIRGKIREDYGADAVTCHPGVDTEKFGRVDYDPTEGIYILSTNRHYPQKRLDMLISCVGKIVESHPEVRCYITGGYTKYTRDLLRLIRRLGLEKTVFLTGNLPSIGLVEKYQHAYLYSYPSPEEDFGLGPLEAGACGVPSVVWDHAGPRETVVEGRTGFRVKPYDLEEYTERHLELLEDPGLRTRMGEAAFRHVRERFTWDNHVEKIREHLKRILE